MVRLSEYVSTINQPLLTISLIVRQFVLLSLVLILTSNRSVTTVHGQLNESTTVTTINTIIISSEGASTLTFQPTTPTTINNYSIESLPVNLTINSNISGNIGTDQNGKQSGVTTTTIQSIPYYHVTSDDQLAVDDINTQSTLITVDVPLVMRSDSNQRQQQSNLDNNRSAVPLRSSIMASNNFLNSSLLLSPSYPNNVTINGTNSSGNHNQSITICDPNRYTFDHQQVAKFFLTTMILLGICCLLIVILLVLVTYIYRKLSKGRNVKVSSRDNENSDNIEIDTIKDGRFYPLRDNVNIAFDEDEFVGTRTDFRFYEPSNLPYTNRNQFNHQHRSPTTQSFGYHSRH